MVFFCTCTEQDFWDQLCVTLQTLFASLDPTIPSLTHTPKTIQVMSQQWLPKAGSAGKDTARAVTFNTIKSQTTARWILCWYKVMETCGRVQQLLSVWHLCLGGWEVELKKKSQALIKFSSKVCDLWKHHFPKAILFGFCLRLCVPHDCFQFQFTSAEHVGIFYWWSSFMLQRQLESTTFAQFGDKYFHEAEWCWRGNFSALQPPVVYRWPHGSAAKAAYGSFQLAGTNLPTISILFQCVWDSPLRCSILFAWRSRRQIAQRQTWLRFFHSPPNPTHHITGSWNKQVYSANMHTCLHIYTHEH